MKHLFYFFAILISVQLSAQNVGIGTNTPLQKLDVAGKAIIRDSLGIGVTSPQAPLQFSNMTANRKIVLYDGLNSDNQFYGFGINPGRLRYQTEGVLSDHAFYAGYSADSSVELMRIKGNGNVGIGITNPAYKLDVNGKGRFNGDVIMNSNDAGGTWFYLNNSSGTPAGWKLITSGTATTGGAGNFFIYDAGNSAALTILKNGNVGIGVSDPTEKLDINGSIKVAGYVKAGYIIVSKDYTLPANSNTIQQCGCPANTVLIGGGGGNITQSDVQFRGVTVSYSGPELDPGYTSIMWTVVVANATAFPATIRAYAICGRIAN